MFLFELFILVFVFFVAGGFSPASDDMTNDLSKVFGMSNAHVRRKRVFFSEKVKKEEAKFVGSLQRKRDRVPLCVGTFITYKVLITSCKCAQFGQAGEAGFPHTKPSEYIVVGGDRYYTNKLDKHTREVGRFLPGENCAALDVQQDTDSGPTITYQIWQFDIGYIELGKDFEQMDSLSVVKNFPANNDEYDIKLNGYIANNSTFAQGNDEFCFVYGWGPKEPKTENTVSEYLRKRAIQFLTNENCQKRFCEASLCDYNVSDSNIICASSRDDKAGPICASDAGTPLVCNDIVWAVGEVSPDCGKKLNLSIFYRLDIEKVQEIQSDGLGGTSKTEPSLNVFIAITIMRFYTKLH